MSYLAAFALGFVSALALVHYAARRIVRPRPFRRSRVAIRQNDYTRLLRQIDEACRQYGSGYGIGVHRRRAVQPRKQQPPQRRADVGIYTTE